MKYNSQIGILGIIIRCLRFAPLLDLESVQENPFYLFSV